MLRGPGRSVSMIRFFGLNSMFQGIFSFLATALICTTSGELTRFSDGISSFSPRMVPTNGRSIIRIFICIYIDWAFLVGWGLSFRSRTAY